MMNYKNVVDAIRKITQEDGLGMSARRITVSTSGIPKMMKMLADENLKVKLQLAALPTDGVSIELDTGYAFPQTKLVDYKGITVAEDTALRVELRQNEVQYGVVKNTLARFALNNVGLESLDEVLNGTTSLATSAGDPIAPMRVVNKYAKQLGDRFNIKGGFMDGKVLSLEEILALAELPAKDVLQAQALGMMLAPITSLAIVLKAIAEKGGEAAPAAEEAAAPAEEAPAAE